MNRTTTARRRLWRRDPGVPVRATIRTARTAAIAVKITVTSPQCRIPGSLRITSVTMFSAPASSTPCSR